MTPTTPICRSSPWGKFARTLGLLLTSSVLLAQTLPVHADEALTYDANGNVLTRTLPGGTTQFGYDDLDRVNSEAGPAKTQSITYDPNDNRLSDGAGSKTYTANTDRLLTENGQNIVLDAAGNITQLRGLTLAWNQAGQLKSVSQGTKTLATYYYDYKGRRSRKVTPTATTIYVYDAFDHLIGEFNGAGSPLRTYVWRDDIPVAIIDPGDVVLYLETDHLNTPIAARNQAGTVVWKWESDAFGASLPNEDPDGDKKKTTINLRFPGQYYDAESGLHNNFRRYYDPKLGRYVSSDPIGLAGGRNTFGYVGGNPLSYSDPLGLQAQGLSVLCGPYFWACAGAATVATVIGVKGTADAISKASSAESCSPKECPPCKTVSGRIVPIGTVGYRPLDVIPDDQMQHGVYGSHHNMFVAQQNPNNCQCFWQKQKYVLKPGNLPTGAIPIEPFVN